MRVVKGDADLISCQISNKTSFFFQAEDGIRDRDVTGVQTCALPISAAPAPPRAYPSAHPRRGRASSPPGRETAAPTAGSRSEERRVGKECRSRWSRYH